MEQAAVVIGKSKKTIYNHKDKNKFSYDIDGDGKAVIDASELLRVYGNKPEIVERLKTLQEPSNDKGNVTTQNYTEKTPSGVKESEIVEYRIKIVKLESELEKEKALKSKTEEDLEYFKDALTKSQETAQKVTLLLENQHGKTANIGNDWQQSLKALETRIANQEKAAKDKAETDVLEKTALEKQLTEQRKEIEEQAQALEEAEDAELKRKEEEYQAAQTWISKMFGKKKTA